GPRGLIVVSSGMAPPYAAGRPSLDRSQALDAFVREQHVGLRIERIHCASLRREVSLNRTIGKVAVETLDVKILFIKNMTVKKTQERDHVDHWLETAWLQDIPNLDFAVEGIVDRMTGLT